MAGVEYITDPGVCEEGIFCKRDLRWTFACGMVTTKESQPLGERFGGALTTRPLEARQTVSGRREVDKRAQPGTLHRGRRLYPMTCPACGKEPPKRKGGGMPRKWCSSRCKAANTRKWKKAHPEAKHRYMLKERYRISQTTYDRMLANQAGMCAICGSTEPGAKARHLAVDHCHESGDIRGLLCISCNSGLGQFKDNLDVMRNAVRYLEAQEILKCL